MRLLAALIVLIFPLAIKAQNFIPSFFGGMQRPQYISSLRLNDSIPEKKWFISRYASISTGFSFYKGGNAAFVAAPMGIQLNRMLNNNLYAYAGISVAPAFVNLNSNYAGPGIKGMQHDRYKQNSFGMYSAAEIGLTYVNDARTFSISGGFSIERTDYPGMPYNQNQPNFTKPNTALPINDDKRLH